MAGTATVQVDPAPLPRDAAVPETPWIASDAARPVEPDAQLEPGDAAPLAPAVSPPGDAAPPEADPNALACESDQWKLARGFRPALKVDYIADRHSSTIPPYVISFAGTPCLTAQDKASCAAALDLGSQVGRHLATTAGDTVRLWPLQAARELLGALDTPAEALWWIGLNGFFVPCATTYTQLPEGILLNGVISPFCAEDASMVAPGEVLVRPDGSVTLSPAQGGTPIHCSGVLAPQPIQ